MRSCIQPPPQHLILSPLFLPFLKGCGCHRNTWLRSARQAVWRLQEVWERDLLQPAEAILNLSAASPPFHGVIWAPGVSFALAAHIGVRGGWSYLPPFKSSNEMCLPWSTPAATRLQKL
ncbi:hypothetical protein TNCT_363941 [Trichonephila clavata]|uniref:Uncharacterized protein n=1 Tax=Trichonephila clavata TaxID=2740835 RepID=A0A8X6LLG9_TRICU|nr:hypothetical protein TNCT_363941 [Trichonephila clavata]